MIDFAGATARALSGSVAGSEPNGTSEATDATPLQTGDRVHGWRFSAE